MLHDPLDWSHVGTYKATSASAAAKKAAARGHTKILLRQTGTNMVHEYLGSKKSLSGFAPRTVEFRTKGGGKVKFHPTHEGAASYVRRTPMSAARAGRAGRAGRPPSRAQIHRLENQVVERVTAAYRSASSPSKAQTTRLRNAAMKVLSLAGLAAMIGAGAYGVTFPVPSYASTVPWWVGRGLAHFGPSVVEEMKKAAKLSIASSKSLLDISKYDVRDPKIRAEITATLNRAVQMARSALGGKKQ